jgi:hypothetical protein
MKLHTIIDSSGRLVAVMRVLKHQKIGMGLKPREGQHFHEIELPDHARQLRPEQIVKRLKITRPGEAPKFTE